MEETTWKLKHKWKDSEESDLREVECSDVNWILTVHNRAQCLAALKR
jgi:hypothetical protein